MKNKTLYLLFSVISLISFNSCYTTKKVDLFKTLPRDTTINSFASPKMEDLIQNRDYLSISVSSLNRELDEQFNGISNAVISNAGENNATLGFMVDDLGFINVHYLGKVKASGITKTDLKIKLEKELTPFLKDPIITIQFKNKKVTVFGDVQMPKIVNIREDRMSIIDVLVSSGDLKEDAVGKDILVIRDSGNQKVVKHINLEDHSVFSSSWYYVQPNDIIYVRRDIKQSDKEERRRELQTTISLLASILSISVVILNLLIK
jgi:polysaccharide export outer membrane protein